MDGIVNLWNRGCVGKLFVVLAIALICVSLIGGAIGVIVQAQSADPTPSVVATVTLAPMPSPATAPMAALDPAALVPSTPAPLPVEAPPPTVNPASDPKSTAFPCLANQVKGNRRSGIYSLPGQSSYKLRSDVRCFDNEAQAQDAGYQRAKT